MDDHLQKIYRAAMRREDSWYNKPCQSLTLCLQKIQSTNMMAHSKHWKDRVLVTEQEDKARLCKKAKFLKTSKFAKVAAESQDIRHLKRELRAVINYSLG